MDDASLPKAILVIRHAEKPGTSGDDKGGGPHLSIRGSARAAALPSLFIPGLAPAGAQQLCCEPKAGDNGAYSGVYRYGTVAAEASRFPTPQRLLATASSHGSHRPLETVTPLAQALTLLADPTIDPTVDVGYGNTPAEIARLAAAVLGTPATYGGKVVLICWHRGTIPALLAAFGVPRGEIAPWDPFPGSVFDVLMQITFSGGQPTMTVAGQQLLAGDSTSAFSSGSITAVLDAPTADLSAPMLPAHFRSCLDALKADPHPPSTVGLTAINASGSAQFSATQLKAVRTVVPMAALTVVDLRQESHGFLALRAPLHKESTIAVGWFAERDWMNVGKDQPSIDLDQAQRLADAAGNADQVLFTITSKTAEDGILTADAAVVHPAGAATEQQIVESLGMGYRRFPTTDHVRPRDEEVDAFVAFAAKPDTWLHFHCRGGDGRTTTFLVMRDVLCNAPGVPIDDIVRRQYLLNGAGANLDKPVNPTRFDAPFAIERRDFVRDFYDYVCAAKGGGYRLTWSAWIVQRTPAMASPTAP
jgi:hypothetical protein